MTLEKFDVLNRWTNAVKFTAEITTTPDMLPSFKLRLAAVWGVDNGANLSDANLSGADLRCADLSRANLSDANLSDADLSRANLSGANLSGANLSGANLSRANLSGADLSFANLSGADLRFADLRFADLSDANLRFANLSRADLSGANLSCANLSCANLSDANLRSIKSDFFMILALGHREVPELVAALRDGRVDGSTYSGECACLVGTLEKAGAVNLPHAADSPAEQWFTPIRKGTKPGDDSEGGFRSASALEWALEYCAATGIELPAVDA